MDQDELAELLLVTFLEEMQEHIGNVNHGLMALEKSPPQRERDEILTVLFRAAHTLKGSSRAVNAPTIETACHAFEEVLTSLRDGRIDFTPEVFSLLFATADAIEETAMWLRDDQDLSAAPLNDLIPQLKQAAGPSTDIQSENTQPSTTHPPQPPESQTAPGQPLADNAVDCQQAVTDGHVAGEPMRASRPAADTTLQTESGDRAAIPDGDTAAVETTKALSSQALRTTSVVRSVQSPQDTPADRDRMEKRQATSTGATVRIAAEKLDSLLAKSGELLIARRRVASRTSEVAELRDLASHWKSEWDVVHKLFRKHKLLVDSADQAAGGSRLMHIKARAAEALIAHRDRIRLLEKRLDRLVATIQADGRHLDTTCDALDDEIHQVRMLPFAEACRGLDRVARDVARTCGKKVELKVEGEDVEIDRSVLEGLRDPLLHLVRNAVDHGLEPSDKRRDAGKEPLGTITISAALRGSEVEVIVDDDGGGINLESIRKKIRQKNLPEPTDEAGLVRMLFHASFSTASVLTDISGRGVGLDVVQSTVENLHGTVQVAFQPGRGSQFIIRVPLTLTTIRNVLVEWGGQTYGIATSSVEQLVRFSDDSLGSMGGRPVLLLGNEPVPLSTLGEVLGMPTLQSGRAETGKQLAIVLCIGQQRAAVVVDAVMAEQEVVVKSLGRRIRRVRQVSGAALLASGRIALVLNVANLLRAALETESTWTLAPDENTEARRQSSRILVVDDSLTTRTLVRSILETAGFDIEVAVDGEDGWARIQEIRPDLVVADVDMPKMNGFELTSTIRRSNQFSNLPVILVTARQTDEDKTRGVQAGANAYIVKANFDQQNLLETIEQLI